MLTMGVATNTVATLPSDLIGFVLEKLLPNDQALSARLINKDACRRLSQLQLCTAHVNQPLPSHIVGAAWQPHLEQHLKHIPFRRTLQMLSAAASSGSELNLQLAWGLLRTSLFPELLQSPAQGPHPPFSYLDRDTSNIYRQPENMDAGTAALRAGHPGLLGWLLQNGCPLSADDTLVAAAEHCDLDRMQHVCQLLGYNTQHVSSFNVELLAKLFEAAGGSAAAGAKLPWLLQLTKLSVPDRQQHELLVSAAAGAAASGNLPVLQWLCGEGLNLHGPLVPGLCPWLKIEPHIKLYEAALGCGHVDVMQWMVDEVGCALPQQGRPRGSFYMWKGAARSGSLQAVRWLLDRGVPVHKEAAAMHAAYGGHVQALQYLHADCGLELTDHVFAAAAGSGSLPTATWLLAVGCPASPEAYRNAARAEDAAMVEWLAREAGCPWGGETIQEVLKSWPLGRGSSRDLGRAVRALVEAGCAPGGTGSVDDAAAGGHLEVVRYLHVELEVEFGPRTLAAAAGGGCEAVVEWLVGAGCAPGAEQAVPGPYCEAGRRGNLATLTCMRRLGVPWDAMTLRQACWVPPPVVRWLLEQGAPWD